MSRQAGVEYRTAYLTAAEWLALPEYSCTMPTGGVTGKRWKRHEPYRRSCSGVCGHWWLGEYVASMFANSYVRWSKIEVVDLPLPKYPAPVPWSPETD